MAEQIEKHRICILVKAYPQPSQKYEETVCCAGVSDEGRLLRLYPIAYRRLRREQQFTRFDWVEMDIFRASDDHRPESYKVVPDSIRIVKRGDQLAAEEKVKVWKPFVSESLDRLRQENLEFSKSLGIVRPEPGTIRFVVKRRETESPHDQAITKSLAQQASLFENSPLPELKLPEYSFEYHFKSGTADSKMKLHDWEAAAAWFSYKRKYGDAALSHMKHEYGEVIPSMNLHFIFGTTKSHPRQFMVIGVLRTKADVDRADAQGNLF